MRRSNAGARHCHPRHRRPYLRPQRRPRIRPAAIEAPPLASADDAKAAPGGAAAKDALAGLLAGGDVVLKQAEAKTDRYGRLVGYAFVTRDDVEHAVQADLIAAGFARVAARAGSRACALELLNRERHPRGPPSLAFGPVHIIAR